MSQGSMLFHKSKTDKTERMGPIEWIKLKFGRCPRCGDRLHTWKNNPKFGALDPMVTIPCGSLHAQFYGCSNCGYRRV